MKVSCSLALLLVLLSCRPHPDTGDESSPIQLLVREAVPPNAKALNCEPPVKRPFSATITCQVAVDSSGPSYQDWIHKTLSKKYRLSQTLDDHLWLTRFEAGEMQRFDIAVEAGADSMCGVRIVLFVDAD
jgi:hypothetical protein